MKDPPFRGNGERNGFNLPGRPVPAGEDSPTATVIHISDGYFATIGAKMIDGREFTAQDRGDSPLVVVVNEAFARQFFPGERAVGKALLFGRNVAGRDHRRRQRHPSGRDGRARAADDVPQQPAELPRQDDDRRAHVGRPARDGQRMCARSIWSIDPNQAITAAFTFDDAVSRALARPRLLTVLLGAFGLVGLALGVVGIYGMLAALVNERRREIGVRLALGARPGQVLMMVVGRGLALATVGVVIGLAAALALSRFLVSVLFGIRPLDPLTFVSMAAVLLAAAAIASWLPARRAAALDPVETLRSE